MTKVSPLGAMVPGGAATGGGPSKSPESVTLLGRVICDDHLSGPKRGRNLEELLKLWQLGSGKTLARFRLPVVLAILSLSHGSRKNFNRVYSILSLASILSSTS